MVKLKGISASSGIAIGKAYFIGKEEFSIPKREIPYSDISIEIYKLEEALINTRKELVSLQEKIAQELGLSHAKIFEAHLLVLEDRVLIENIIEQIKTKRVNVEYAFSESIKKYKEALLKLNDEYLRERAIDIDDIAKRVLRKLLKVSPNNVSEIKEKVIIVAHDLSPSLAASLPKENILGIVTDIGGITSHTAIIARSLKIPALVGVEVATKEIQPSDILIIDALEGIVLVNPSEKTIKEYEIKLKEYKEKTLFFYIPKFTKTVTKDKKEFIISANIEFPEELELVEKYKAEGIGLYRTEYLFLGRKDLPSEEEQYKAYLLASKVARGHSVVIRTIDIGGDKFLDQKNTPTEMRPFLGWRGIRFCLSRPDIFKVQLRAILRASYNLNIKIMFPMISGVEELKAAKKILEECKEELRRENKKFDENIPVGAMIEVPSAALTADILAKESDFFSIGTNDLIQYSLAVDRANEKVAYLFDFGHPAVLRLIKSVIDIAHQNNIWVGMCGEMAGEPIYSFLLLGFGLDEFSMPPPRVPQIRHLIRSVSFKEAQQISEEALRYSNSKDLELFLKTEIRKRVKEFDLISAFL